MSKFELTLESTAGAPAITFRFNGDTLRAELDGACLLGESEGDDRTRVLLTDAYGGVLADVTVHPRAHRDATGNVTDIGCALMWSHWRYVQSMPVDANDDAAKPARA